MYKLFLTIRYLLRRKIAYFAVFSVTICVAMVLIVLSVMGGFVDNVRNRARGMLGDIIVDNRTSAGFPLYDEFISAAREHPDVVEATPVLYSWGLFRVPRTNRTGPTQIVGVRLREIVEVNAFANGLHYERYFPGMLSLEDRSQVALGLEWVPGVSEDTGEAVTRGKPILPPEWADAWEQAQRDGVELDGFLDYRQNHFRRQAGADPIPGNFELIPPVFGRNDPGGAMGPELPGIVLGREIACERQSDASYVRYYPHGEPVQLTIVPIDVNADIIEPRKQAFRYVDDLRTGIYEIDSKSVYVDFDLLQRLLDMGPVERADGTGIAPARCSQIQVKIAPDADAQAVALELQELYQQVARAFPGELDFLELDMLSDITAKTWEQSQAHLIGPVEKERALISIIIGIVSLVAAVLVLCILYMIVLQKTRDIGLLKAVGASSGGVSAIFVAYGAAVGVVGAILGSIGGYYFVTYINEIEQLLISLNPAWQVWDRAVYSFDQIPNTVRNADIATVIISALLSSIAGSLLAAWRAGAMHPLEALRYE